MTDFISAFFCYSFLGFLIELLFSRFVRGKRHDRKCFFLSPLCPVYGLGAAAILALPNSIFARPGLLFVCGALVASLTEYAMALFYEYGLGVKFWDYADVKGNLHGRICPLFSFFWGVLACLLVYGLHPILGPILRSIPPLFVFIVFVFVSIDTIFTLLILHQTANRDSLKWYEKFQRAS